VKASKKAVLSGKSKGTRHESH